MLFLIMSLFFWKNETVFKSATNEYRFPQLREKYANVKCIFSFIMEWEFEITIQLERFMSIVSVMKVILSYKISYQYCLIKCKLIISQKDETEI